MQVVHAILELKMELQQADNTYKLTIEEHLRILMQTSIDGIVCIDSNNTIIEFNQASEIIFGRKREDVIGRSLTKTIIPFRYRESHERGLKRYLLSGQASMMNKTVEVSAIRSNGDEFPVELSISQLRNEDESYFVAYIRDISIRRRIEHELRESNEKLKASDELLSKLANNLPGAIFQLKRNQNGVTKFSYLSKGFARIFELTSDASKADAESVWIHVHDEDKTSVLESLDQSSRHLTNWRLTFRISLANQSERWIQVDAKPERTNDGGTLWHGYLEDATYRLHTEKLLNDTQINMQKLLETLPIGMLVHKDGRLMYANPRVFEIFGATGSQSLDGLVANSLVDPKSESKFYFHPADPTIGETEVTPHKNTEFRCVRLDGTPIDVETQASRVHFMGEDAVQVTVVDISERKRIQRNLQLAASVFTHTRDGIAIADADQRIVEVNDAFTRITGYQQDEITGQLLEKLQSQQDTKSISYRIQSDLVEFGFWDGELVGRHKSGKEYLASVSICLVRNTSGNTESIIVLFSDVTLANKHKQQLEYIAHYDALTGLPNRVLLADRLKQALSQCARQENFLAVVYLDLDGFKQINDRNGHSAGDNFLAAIAPQLKSALRETDTLARIGGDEFIAIIGGLDNASECEPILHRLLEAAGSPVHSGDAISKVSASIGVSLYPRDGLNADLLVRRADQAMYIAKESGKNKYCFFDITTADAIELRQSELERIREGISSNEFILHFQPKVNMVARQIVGAEVLIRWQHPDRGLLHPIQFLPLIENHPVSIELGEWVIGETIKQMIRWSELGITLNLSVNISAYQLQSSEFPIRLKDFLSGCPKFVAQHLQFEVLETSAVENLEQVSKSINACLELGVTFALDDFGTGYSSLSHLKHLPADTLKIDRGFVREMLNEGSDLAIVKGVIGLANALGLSVVAEGVETKDHAEKLVELNCCIAQGYYFAVPMDVDGIYSWIALERNFPNLEPIEENLIGNY